MKANELRIGNLVSDICGKTLTIDRFYGKKIECDIKNMPNKDPLTNIPIYYHPLTEEIEFCKPIPITEEWLLKFGFEREYELRKTVYHMNNYSIILWVYKNGRIDLRIGGIDFKDKDVRFKKYQYVHQLQNLYYALTQTELEIETLQV